jgi:hypothetical protein
VSQSASAGDGKKVTRLVPPAPGLEAHLTNGKVEITFDTGTPPAACRPRIIRILIDDDNYSFPPFSETYPLREMGRQTMTVPISPALQSRPSLVQASLGLLPELRGPASRVKVP